CAGGDPPPHEVQLLRRQGRADLGHPVTLAGREVPLELPNEEARRRVPGNDADDARRLRGGIRRGNADEIVVRDVGSERETAGRGRPVTRRQRAARREYLPLERGERRRS